MSNTIRDLSELLSLFADNNSNQITAQDIRDFIVTTDAWRFSKDYGDLENRPELGTLSSQDYDNVNITGGILTNISLLNVGSINPGISLSPGTFSTTRVSIRSSLIDFKVESETEILTVPANHMFLIDSMEILTTNVIGLDTSLRMRFGSSDYPEEFYLPSDIRSVGIGDRHIVEVAQNAATPGKVVTVGVSLASSADVHEGFGIIYGTLVRIA